MKFRITPLTTAITLAILMLVAFSNFNCGSSTTTGHDEGDEESGQQFTRDQTYDKIRNGARLILSYDPQANAFTGTVENTTSQTLSRVRVEVHLSNGKELGPTKPQDLKPGEKMNVTLTAQGENFNKWSAHPEVGGGQ